MFDAYIRLWGLVSDGNPILTATSRLLPVVFEGQQAILKVATCDEEHRGNAVLAWWHGDGAARVLAHRDDAVLMERAQSSLSLASLSQSGQDDSAMRIACTVLNTLHAHAPRQRPCVVSLGEWFRPLRCLSSTGDGILRVSAIAAVHLLSGPRVEEVVLHGDIHHGNILYFGEWGWLAIDPKGLFGERGFDYANLFCRRRTWLGP
ncbi:MULTISPECIES: aminoglycoside phosphotransferase family protein [Cupriavidus]|uniref:aminoglycoside phosphotransferase family protein n=1 Tax=Cupriavidus TaxID=106589 RepID=UPI0004B042C4|nr:MULTISPECIES: aminoglycoside phosphotransferase family protein [Cupriavidus]